MLMIQNCYMIDPASGTEGRRDILIDNGRFVKIEKHLMAPVGASVLDASGMIACPGLIDTHSHFRDPGFTHKEDLSTGAQAAIAGGYTSIILMANTKPPVDSVEILRDILTRGRELPVHLYSCANVTLGMAGEKLSDLRECLRREGADFLVLSKLDDIMWLTNLRGNDVECNPVALSYAVITMDSFTLFVQGKEITEAIQFACAASAITVTRLGAQQSIPYIDEIK